MVTQTTSLVDQILAPLEAYSSEVMRTSKGLHLRSLHSSSPAQTMTHAEFIKQQVLPILEAAMQKWGPMQTLQALVDVVLPAYEVIPASEMASFWSVTIRGVPDGSGHDEEYPRKNQGLLNPDLAAQFGVAEVYGPILSLARTHVATDVFGINKFFVTHACRMGVVIRQLGLAGFNTYVYLCHKLLRHGVYDWSLEWSAEEWEALTPAIHRYGFWQVLLPFANVMANLGHVPGANDCKYHYSLLRQTLRDLLPLILERVMEGGPRAIYEIAQPIVDYVDVVHERGGFNSESNEGLRLQEEFFGSFGDYLPDIRERGIEQVLKSVSTHWTARLLSHRAS